MRWEYWAAEFKPNFVGGYDFAKMMTEFNALGEEGWELVSTEPIIGQNLTRIYIFKRRGDDAGRSIRTGEK